MLKKEEVSLNSSRIAGYRCRYCGRCESTKKEIRQHISNTSDADHRDRNGFDNTGVIEEVPEIEPLLKDDFEASDLTKKQQAAIVEYARSPSKTYAELAEAIDNRDNYPDICVATINRTLLTKCRREITRNRNSGYSRRNERQQETIDTLARCAHEYDSIVGIANSDNTEEQTQYLYSVVHRYANLVMERRKELPEAPDPESLSPEEDSISSQLDSDDWYNGDNKKRTPPGSTEGTGSEQIYRENTRGQVTRSQGKTTFEDVPMASPDMTGSSADQNESDSEASKIESRAAEVLEKIDSTKQEVVTKRDSLFAPIIVLASDDEELPAREVRSLLDTMKGLRDIIQQDDVDGRTVLREIERHLTSIGTEMEIKIDTELSERAD